MLRLRAGSAVLALAVVVVTVAGLIQAASATQDQMWRLPGFSGDRNGCLICHVGPSVTSQTVNPTDWINAETSLSSFGKDWVRSGRTWSVPLAAGNSDGDACTNGFELNDENGSWQYNPNGPQIARPAGSNPSDATDCALPLNEQSWGVLKAFFREDFRR